MNAIFCWGALLRRWRLPGWATPAVVLAVLLPGASASALPLAQLRLPPGFEISLFAAEVPGARSLAVAGDGTVFVGTRHEGRVYALPDGDRDGRADQVIVIAEGLNSPNGVAIRGDDLYVMEIHRLLRYPDMLSRLKNPPSPQVLAGYPHEEHHGWRFIAFGPDGRLYIPIGAPCNICLRQGYAVITSVNPQGKDRRIEARGVRNTVGFDWHPRTNELWFSDNGRDWMGDDRPPDELNRLQERGEHFGFPFCHGGDIPDPAFGEVNDCRKYTPPVLKLPAHVAALGLRFYTGGRFPESYRHDILLAEHGSWNRSSKVGYRVMRVDVSDPQKPRYEVFVEGWLSGESAWGRPVDVAVLEDGSVLVSDDKAGVVYRIDYIGSAPGGEEE